MTAYDFAKHAYGVSAMHPPWLILEELPYELSQVPRDNPVGMAVDILSGVQAVHFASYIHRDLKPDNVRAAKSTLSDGSDKWTLKICDASSATLQTAADKGLAGTPNYMAPEIWKNRNGYDERVDVFSLGIVVLSLLTPYTAEQHAKLKLAGYNDVVSWVINVAGPFVQGAQPLHQPLLYGMLALDPQDRWGTQRCMNYLSCLSGPSRANRGGDGNSDGDRPRRKRRHGLLEEDDASETKPGDARTARPRLEKDGEANTPACSTASSYDGTFYTAPVIHTGGLEGGGTSNVSEAPRGTRIAMRHTFLGYGRRALRPYAPCVAARPGPVVAQLLRRTEAGLGGRGAPCRLGNTAACRLLPRPAGGRQRGLCRVGGRHTSSR